MRFFKPKDLLKISILLMLFILCIGSIYASDPIDNQKDIDDYDSDWDIKDLDDYYDQFGKWHDHDWSNYDWGDDDSDDDSGSDDGDDDFDDDSSSDDGDDDFDDEDWDDDSEFDDGDEDWDDDSGSDDGDDDFDDEDWDDDSEFDDGDDDFDDEDWDDEFSEYDYDFDTLKSDILSSLDLFGNSSDENWTESDEFNRVYQLYLMDNTSYGLNESDENYDTYLKIYNAFVSSFEDYNLSDNETAYLKCLIMYYLNNYGNCTNSTWDEFISFYKSLSFSCCLGMFGRFSASASAPDAAADDKDDVPGNDAIQYMDLNLNDNMLSAPLGHVVESNSTSTDNVTVVGPQNNDSWLTNLLMLLVIVLFVVLSII